jgi:16S rRNA processing protein RimM
LQFKKVYILKNKRYEAFFIEKIRGLQKALIIKVYGINSPEEVKKYNRCEIWVEKKYASSLKRNEYYVSDLCQCYVYFKGKRIGKITSVYEAVNADLLEIIDGNDKVSIIPFLDHFVGEVDIENKHIHLREDCVLL